jgi:hypothetical protein
MAFSNVTLLSVVQESQDATEIRIWDESTWGGQSGNVTGACIVISYYDSDGDLKSLDPYYLIVGQTKTKWDEYLDKQNGHIIDIDDLTVSGVAFGDKFTDGYYIVTLYVTDGTYGTFIAGGWLKYANSQAFLARARFTSRKLPATLTWPLTDEVRVVNKDIFLLQMYLNAAEDAADYGLLTEFNNIITLVNAIFSYYKIENIWS